MKNQLFAVFAALFTIAGYHHAGNTTDDICLECMFEISPKFKILYKTFANTYLVVQGMSGWMETCTDRDKELLQEISTTLSKAKKDYIDWIKANAVPKKYTDKQGKVYEPNKETVKKEIEVIQALTPPKDEQFQVCGRHGRKLLRQIKTANEELKNVHPKTWHYKSWGNPRKRENNKN